MGSALPGGRLLLLLPPEQAGGQLGETPRLPSKQRLPRPTADTGETGLHRFLLVPEGRRLTRPVCDVPAGSHQQRLGLIQSQRALAGQRSPRPSSAGRKSRVPRQTEAGGSSALPDESDACRHRHPGENAAGCYSRTGHHHQISAAFTSRGTVRQVIRSVSRQEFELSRSVLLRLTVAEA